MGGGGWVGGWVGWGVGVRGGVGVSVGGWGGIECRWVGGSNRVDLGVGRGGNECGSVGGGVALVGTSPRVEAGRGDKGEALQR